MAIVKMKHLRLVSMKDDRAALLTDLQRMGCVEINEPTVDWRDPQYAPFTQPSTSALTKAREQLTLALRGQAILKSRLPEKGGLLRPRPRISEKTLFDEGTTEAALAVAHILVDTDRHIASCKAEQVKIDSQMAALRPWQTLDLPLDTQSTGTIRVHLGTVPASVPVETLEGSLVAEGDSLTSLAVQSSDRESHYILLLVHTSQEETVLETLKSLGWSRASLRGIGGTAAENLSALSARRATLDDEIAADEAVILAQGEHREALQLLEDRLAQEVSREGALGLSVDCENAFMVEGWIPAEAEEKLTALLANYTCAYETEEPAEEDYHKVPVSLKNNWFTAPLNMVTEMYSLPAYGGLDPNPLMAPFFIFFYGVMMADMGYGILMMLAGGLVLAKTNPAKGKRNFAGLILLCGVSTFLMGIITGGFFGDFIPQIAALTMGIEISLPSLFSPLDDALMVLIGSLVLGVIQIATAMIVSMVKQIRRGQTMDAICNEGAWFATFIVLGVAGALGQLNIGLILAGVILVMTQSYGKKGIIAKLMAIFGSLYNNVTGYFSDILSYSRLMALMLAGAVIAQVFNTLGALTGNVVLFVIIAMVGNALNFGLNLLGCYVHDLRLQCLEYFGRFYEDGGRAFKPLALDTKHVEVID